MSLTDRILGRQRIKERVSFLEDRIESLEEEKKELKRKAEKEERRAREAVSKKQELDEEINRQRDKIESMKDRLRKKEFVEETTTSGVDGDKVDRDTMTDLLDKLQSMESSKEDIFSVFLPESTTLRNLDSDGLLQTNLTLNQLRRLEQEDSETGKVFFHCENLLSILIKPPVPVDREQWVKDSSFVVEPLREKLESKVGFVFLSAGGSAVALFGEELEDFDVVKSKIKGKHKKGGFSQDRFQRGRDEDIKKHIEEVVRACEDIIPEDIETLAVGGSPEMVGEFRESDLADDKNFFVKKLDVSSVKNPEDVKVIFSKFWKSDLIRI